MVDSMIEELVRPVIKEQIENALMQNGLTFRQAVFYVCFKFKCRR